MTTTQGPSGLDDFFATPNAKPAPPSPVEPSWTSPQLQPTDPITVAQPGMTFASAVAAAPVSAPLLVSAAVAAPPVAVPSAAVMAAPIKPVVAPLVAPVAAPPVVRPSAPAYDLQVAPVAAPVLVAIPVTASSMLSAVPAQAVPTAPVTDTPAALDQEGTARVGAEDTTDDSMFLTDLLIAVLERKCSDLHMTVGAPPTVRENGHLVAVEGKEILTPQAIQKVIYAIMSQKQREKFEEELELDFAYSVPGRARFRVNVYRQRDALGAAFRLIPYEIKALEDLGVPPAVGNFAMLPRGFVLVTGPTGSGKSTTLAAVVDLANRQRKDHIMTVEDPIEFLHEHKSCLINQREVGEDTRTFQAALKHVLRQDPDIILVGEMRDLETIEVALTAAETGHLVMATLHTSDAAQTIDRIIDVFPPHQQQQVRVQLASALQGVVCQQLIRTADGKGRVVATEILVATPAIRNLIREGKTHQIYSAMQAGAKHGMATMDQHLAELVRRGKITYDAALEKCHHVEDFNRLCGRA